MTAMAQVHSVPLEWCCAALAATATKLVRMFLTVKVYTWTYTVTEELGHGTLERPVVCLVQRL
jgi:hypothetical protein